MSREYYPPRSYRYPSELSVLVLTLGLTLAVVAISAVVTLCASGVFIAGMLIMAYLANRAHHQALMDSAYPLTSANQPRLAALVRECVATLRPPGIEVFIAPGNALNAYAFGLSRPNTIVLFAPLFEVMDEEEMKFIISHEIGHVCLGHTWLNTLIGGMAGVPSPFGAALILAFAFRWWNRSCEYSADRAGLLACGNQSKATSALVKLVAGRQALDPRIFEAAQRQIESEDDQVWGLLGEALSTHPLLVKRIEQLRAYAASAEYRRLSGTARTA